MRSAAWVWRPGALLFPGLILASPIQIQNMIWGFQIQFYTLSLSIAGGVIVVALIGSLTWSAVAIAVVAAFAATFSIGSGVMAWPVLGLTLIVVALPSPGGLAKLLRDKEAMMRLAVFAAAGVVILGLYFNGYR